MNTQATPLNCVHLKQSANWCSFYTQNDLKKIIKKYYHELLSEKWMSRTCQSKEIH